jgi:hypothetical protein
MWRWGCDGCLISNKRRPPGAPVEQKTTIRVDLNPVGAHRGYEATGSMFAAKLRCAMGTEGESVDEVQLLVFRSSWLFKIRW